ncbi:MAG TPA: hypothetical protein VHX19_01700 [Stellaceae bacterium]|jgi:hypothetical protein|nr:hypothetical protein [Stellaceae bacterium]
MTTAEALRRKAALCRRAARIKTTGGSEADAYLIELAEQLERQAAELDRAAPKS